MSEQLATVTINILDKEYRVSCQPDQEQALTNAAKYLDDKMRNIRSGGNIIGTERIAVMAAINIAHEMLKSANESHLAAEYSVSQVDKLISKLNRVLCEA